MQQLSDPFECSRRRMNLHYCRKKFYVLGMNDFNNLFLRQARLRRLPEEHIFMFEDVASGTSWTQIFSGTQP